MSMIQVRDSPDIEEGDEQMTDKEKLEFIREAVNDKFVLDRPTLRERREIEEVLDNLEQEMMEGVEV